MKKIVMAGVLVAFGLFVTVAGTEVSEVADFGVSIGVELGDVDVDVESAIIVPTGVLIWGD